VIFRRDLDALARENRDRLRVVHTLTRERVPVGREEDVRTGRVSLELLRELIPDPKTSIVYACGRVPADRIHRESYG
jgi:ferredoxin-NADP reductase